MINEFTRSTQKAVKNAGNNLAYGGEDFVHAHTL